MFFSVSLWWVFLLVLGASFTGRRIQNVFADAPLLVPAVSDEALVKENPQVMLSIAATREQEEETKSLWRRLPLTAVRQGHAGFVHPDLISRSTPRILQGAQQICEQVDLIRR